MTPPMTTQNITLDFAALAHGLALQNVPARVQTLAQQAILDWFGVTLAGTVEPVARAALRLAELEGSQAPCGVVGRQARFSACAAAYLNGTAAHALDYDDVNFAVTGHATVPVFSAALAAAEQTDASGATLLEAFIAGYELTCRIGQLLAPSHYARGFHATATIGCLGAAVAAAKVFQLDADGIARALSIACVRGAGLKAGFGSSLKPLQVGEAARAGLQAAQLAQLGLDTPADMIGHRLGFAATHADGLNLEAAFGTPRCVSDFTRTVAADAPALGYHLEANLFKYHASCFETHPAIEASLAVAAMADYDASRVQAVQVFINHHCNDICNILHPTTGLQAKFSVQHSAAMALNRCDTTLPQAFDDASANDPGLVRFRRCIEVCFDDSLRAPQSRVELRLDSGKVLVATHDSAVPNADVAAQQAKVDKKFRLLASRYVPAPQAERLESAVKQLHGLPQARALMDAYQLN